MKTKHLFSSLILFCMVVLGTSCSSFRPGHFNLTQNQSQVVLSEANFEVVRRVEGVETVRYFFGVGGVLKNGLVGAAKADMYQNANLSGSQAIIDTHLEFKTSNIIPGIWGSIRCVATGTVVEFKN